MKRICLFLIVVFGLFAPKAEAGPGTITSSVCFQFPQGTCLANGSIVFSLNTSARAISGGQVVPTTVSVTLDSTGNIPANTSLYANDKLQPTGTFYQVRIYNGTGSLVSGPTALIWVIAGASPIDLSLITASSGSPDPGLSNPILSNPAAPQTITGQPLTLTSSAPLTVGAQVTSTVSTGTAPFSIASTTVVPNLNAQLLGGLPAPASSIVGISDSQNLTNKTVDGFTIAHAASQASAATNFGTALSSQTVVSSVPSTGVVNLLFQLVQVTAGVGCSASSNTVQVNLVTYTAPGGNKAPFNPTVNLTITGNGFVDDGEPGQGGGVGFNNVETFGAKAGTSISYTTTSTLASTGCTTTPQYVIYAKAIF